ncbi:glucose-1-phosphate adenylyltransferase [Candidatus Atribacteria bacterium RBG_19FT_COMBO_35_14]|uniref:Glucose-1-phosphate adenylyltransferase n=1 Tax=Candidatus Sediminicultor quintus TaxID=1797291 RepID=A0A1F5AAV4_9BACT|nr:MAG: glucose-1-phosphate adenylyltransferase [Candidatus Atribacteria bacterium RBG_19FT_COMBO_35_14]
MAKEVLALILAGGQSTRLGTLNKKLAKPAFTFGGKYRIIDFTLSNCANSDINTVGVLTQFEPLVLNSYIGIGRPWDLDRKDGGVNILPPYLKEKGGEWYKGTANAVYQNMDYIDMQNPKYVLVLSGDHIYKMDYAKMIDFHKEKESEATITVIKVPLKEASRFGIMNTREDNSIYEFDEKPEQPKNDLASMGVYLFNWEILKKYLAEDDKNKSSSHDFGKNIIPAMLGAGVKLYAYPFKGYWKDVGTIESLWQANMDLLKIDNELNLFDKDWKIYSVNPLQPPQYVSRESKVVNSMISEGCKIFGTVVNSVLSPGVQIGKGVYVSDTVIMRNAIIRENTIIHRSIIGSRCEINEECSIGKEDSSNITVVPYDYFMEGGTVYE